PGVEIIGMSDCRLPASLYSDRYGVIVCGSPCGPCHPTLLEPGEVRSNAHACGAGVRVLFIEPSVLIEFGAGRGLTRILRFRITGAEYAPLVVAVDELCAAVEQNASASEQRARLQTCLQSMLDLMVESSPSAHGTHPAVTAARDYLRRRVHKTITLEEL